MTTETQRDQLQLGDVIQIGQVPNVLALSHYITTSPLLQKQAVFVVVKNEIDRHIIAQTVHFFNTQERQCTEWNDNNMDLLRFDDPSGMILCDAMQLERTRLPSRRTFIDKTLELSVGEEVSLQEVKELLTINGLERETSANEPGRWSGRGNIIDVYTDQPIRIEFDNNTITALNSFSLKTGKKKRALDSCRVPPLHQAGRSSLLDYLPDDAVIVLYEQEAVENAHAQLIVSPLQIPGSTDAGYKETKSYHLRYEEIQQDASSYATVFACTAHKKKLVPLLPKNATTIPLTVPSRGFIHASSRTIVLTDQAVGISEQEYKEQSQKVQQALIQSLHPGDYVVHAHHGIARFGGMTTMHVNKLDREYFICEYADADKIYVPVELADRIDKYLGSPHPTLHRLSDASWGEVVARVKKHALVLAKDLLHLYAKRTIATTTQYSEQTEEEELDKKCPFELTKDQQQALQDVYHDMQQETPMDRLLCGDVGFGKTEVAIRAAFRAVLNGRQVALLAPTTVLAQQHFDTFSERLQAFGISIGRLSRLQTAKQQQQVIHGVRNGTIDVIIGTHRLLSKDVHFKRLGFIIIDEEQRFGVKAKEALKQLRADAHILSMTATPIPRTLHLSLSGIRDISTILTAPQERKAVETFIQPLSSDVIAQAIKREMKRKGQTYYIYNRVRSIELRRKELQVLVPTARIGVIHGQMRSKELAAVMHEFDTGKIDVLLATTIVENGLDIPRANTLVVEHASMFGLAELYQLKGRVGRSDRQGYAYFFYKERELEPVVKERFVALQETQELGSGFELAMRDMEIRGVGNILGKEQHGHAEKIGLHLYIRLLNRAVQELQGVELQPERDIPIDLPIEAYIPERILPNEADRVILYQQLAAISERKALLSKKDQFSRKQRFATTGSLDPALEGLFQLLEIKLLASRSSLLSIDTTYPTDMNRLTSPRITISSDKPLVDLPAEWNIVYKRDSSDHVARATLEELGERWIEKLKLLIQQLRTSPES